MVTKIIRKKNSLGLYGFLGNCDILIVRMIIEELKSIVVSPKFLKDEISEIGGEIKHFIFAE